MRTAFCGSALKIPAVEVVRISLLYAYNNGSMNVCWMCQFLSILEDIAEVVRLVPQERVHQIAEQMVVSLNGATTERRATRGCPSA